MNARHGLEEPCNKRMHLTVGRLAVATDGSCKRPPAGDAQRSADTGASERSMMMHAIRAMMTALVPLLVVAAGAWAQESTIDDSLLGCRWSAKWRELPSPSGELKTPVPGKKIRHANPKWPKDRVGRTGSGAPVVEAVLDERGRVIDARVVRRPNWKPRSWPELDEAILAAVRKWRYTPATLDGRAVPACVSVTVHIHWR